jgi:Tfp pilus assembly protein PilF
LETTPTRIRLGKSEPSADAFTGRGIAYIALRTIHSRHRRFQHAIQLKPDAVLPYLERGIAYAQIGNVQLAITDFDTVLDREPSNDRALEQRAAAWAKLGRSQEGHRGFHASLWKFLRTTSASILPEPTNMPRWGNPKKLSPIAIGRCF